MRAFNRSMPSAERGLSIIELMIAMVLGLLLIAGVLQVFLGNRQAQRVEQSVSRIEENGRVAMDLIVSDLRMTGYYGCSKLLSGEIVPTGSSPVFTILAKSTTYNAPVSANFLSSALRGFTHKNDNSWSPALSADLNTAPTAIDGRTNSDVISIYFGQPTGMILTAAVSGASDISVTNPNRLDIKSNKSQLLISNCATTDMFTLTSTVDPANATATLKHEATGNSSASLSTSSSSPYGLTSKISLFTDRVYYVKRTGRLSPDGTDIYSLWRRDNNGTPQELVEGIEFLHFLYGEKLASGNIRYAAADASPAINWANVVSVQVALMTKSYDAVRTTADDASYKLLNWDVAAPGGSAPTHSGKMSLRRVYTATVELRNRVE